jgi:hypothetical protein
MSDEKPIASHDLRNFALLKRSVLARSMDCSSDQVQPRGSAGGNLLLSIPIFKGRILGSNANATSGRLGDTASAPAKVVSSAGKIDRQQTGSPDMVLPYRKPGLADHILSMEDGRTIYPFDVEEQTLHIQLCSRSLGQLSQQCKSRHSTAWYPAHLARADPTTSFYGRVSFSPWWKC